MATAGTSIDLYHGDTNQIRWDGISAEVVTDLGLDDMTSGDTLTFVTKLKTVRAVIGLPPQWTWSQSGQTVTINVLGAPILSGTTDLEVLVVGPPIL